MDNNPACFPAKSAEKQCDAGQLRSNGVCRRERSRWPLPAELAGDGRQLAEIPPCFRSRSFSRQRRKCVRSGSERASATPAVAVLLGALCHLDFPAASAAGRFAPTSVNLPLAHEFATHHRREARLSTLLIPGTASFDLLGRQDTRHAKQRERSQQGPRKEEILRKVPQQRQGKQSGYNRFAKVDRENRRRNLREQGPATRGMTNNLPPLFWLPPLCRTRR